MKFLLVSAIRWYQLTTPNRIRRCCRFEPTCSHYTIIALEKYGVVAGLRKGINRLLRCRAPNGGVDIP
ncbi:MAG: hypothetical protein CMO26_21390 [Thiotrichales bacterium]|nr:hypothetical protein [Thiotrichales bacterium]